MEDKKQQRVPESVNGQGVKEKSNIMNAGSLTGATSETATNGEHEHTDREFAEFANDAVQSKGTVPPDKVQPVNSADAGKDQGIDPKDKKTPIMEEEDVEGREKKNVTDEFQDPQAGNVDLGKPQAANKKSA